MPDKAESCFEIYCDRGFVTKEKAEFYRPPSESPPWRTGLPRRFGPSFTDGCVKRILRRLRRSASATAPCLSLSGTLVHSLA
jgi:hypothetical protein